MTTGIVRLASFSCTTVPGERCEVTLMKPQLRPLIYSPSGLFGVARL